MDDLEQQPPVEVVDDDPAYASGRRRVDFIAQNVIDLQDRHARGGAGHDCVIQRRDGLSPLAAVIDPYCMNLPCRKSVCVFTFIIRPTAV